MTDIKTVLTDGEMLELAAKAAGLNVRFELGSPPLYIDSAGTGRYWNPLRDDGDAFRLQVDMDMKVRYHSVLGQALVNCPCRDEVVENVEDHGRDKRSATRRAIVRAAALQASQSPQDQVKP